VDEKKESPSRGMAIQLREVEGATILDEAGPKTQDFLLINQPRFAFADVAQYLALTRLQFANKEDIRPFFAPPQSPSTQKTLGIIGGIKATVMGNPIESPYFSASPFLLGKGHAAKFAVRPRNPGNTELPLNPAPNYLREALKKSLDPSSGAAAVFDFQIQLRTEESEKLPIEDAATEWDKDAAPYQNVAVLTIPPQEFDTPLQNEACENLVLTPWHGLVEHRPLGGINRLRKQVYIASALKRKESSQTTATTQ
jgi:hypothetical protein